MLCPLLTLLNKVDNSSLNCSYCGNPKLTTPEIIECQEDKCMWYIRKSGKTEVYDCAITALAVYNLPHYRRD